MAPLVRIDPVEYDVDIALAYAGPDNFTGKPVYRADAGCFLLPEAAACLARTVALARAQGLRLRLLDAFRPVEAQWALWNHSPIPGFLADPRVGSLHSMGAALDLTLLDGDGRALDLGTAFDAFTPLSHHGNTEIGAEAQRNRFLLLGLMTSAGWDYYRNEWWHYQLPCARGSYPLLTDSVLGPQSMMPA